MGELYYDSAADRHGILQDVSGARVFLRPEGGGREWTALDSDLHHPADAERIRAHRARAQRAALLRAFDS
ncbi:hypothetical protein ACFQZC_38485 [Streptacidiphilus monticola]